MNNKHSIQQNLYLYTVASIEWSILSGEKAKELKITSDKMQYDIKNYI